MNRIEERWTAASTRRRRRWWFDRAIGSLKESAVQLGMIGLERMGANMARRLLAGGHQCVAFDRSPKAIEQLTNVDVGTGGGAFGLEFPDRVLSAMRYEFGGHRETVGAGEGRPR
jgi:lactate dehydrogenase-like 2-hydroxyacid dehydrogenase